jgi:hypothetical protein
VAPGEPAAAIHLGALVVCPEDLAGWRETMARADAPQGVVLTWGAETTIETASGWPAAVAELTTLSAGTRKEHRLLVTYRFLHTVAAVLVRSRVELCPRLGEIGDILTTARPDFRTGEPIAISELWERVSDPSGDR